MFIEITMLKLPVAIFLLQSLDAFHSKCYVLESFMLANQHLL